MNQINFDLKYYISKYGDLDGKPSKNIYILGRRNLGWNTTSVLEDVARYLDTTQTSINKPVVGTTYYAISTSANDKNGSAGASKLRLVYLDVNGDQQVSSITLNGTTAVSIGSGYTYFQWMEVSEFGTADAVAAAGDISIGSINGVATVATTMEFIAAGGNRSLSARYMIPRNHTGYLNYFSAGSHGGTAKYDVRLRATVFADDRTISPNIHHFQDLLSFGNGFSEIRALDYLRCPALSEIKVSAVSSGAAAGNRLDCSFRVVLVNEQ